MKHFFVEISRSCMRHDLLNLSANISFYAILSLLPLMMIFVSILGHVMGSSEIVDRIMDTITGMIPGAGEIFMSNIKTLVKGKSSLGIWGIGFLLFISTVLFGSLERAFDKIFDSEKKRHFLYSRLLSILVIFIILIFLALPSTFRLLEASLVKYGFSLPLVDYLTGKTFFVIFAVFAYVATVIIITNHRVYIRYAFVGGAIFAAGITIAKFIFQWYLTISFSRYNLIYGSLTAMILTVIWIYYLSIVLLVSAEVVAYLQGLGRGKGAKNDRNAK